MWEKKNADGNGSGVYDHTSLIGTDKKIRLERLPPKLHTVISKKTSATVIKIWLVYFYTGIHRAVARALIGGGGGLYIHIFRFCPTNFF